MIQLMNHMKVVLMKIKWKEMEYIYAQKVNMKENLKQE